MIRDPETGWTEAEITINGQRLSFPESMALRVAVSSYRMFVRDEDNAAAIGERLADGYDHHLAAIEAAIMRRK